MRKPLLIFLVWALVLPLGTARAGDVRKEFGIILSPVPMVGDRPLTEAALCTPHEKERGFFGVVFPLNESEGDGEHMFLVRDAEMGSTPPPTDVDVTFYRDIGSCDPSSLRLPAPSDPPVFATPGNEQGWVPEGMRYAVVTIRDGLLISFEIRLWS